MSGGQGWGEGVTENILHTFRKFPKNLDRVEGESFGAVINNNVTFLYDCEVKVTMIKIQNYTSWTQVLVCTVRKLMYVQKDYSGFLHVRNCKIHGNQLAGGWSIV